MDRNEQKICQRGRIVGMREAGMSMKGIARELGISLSTVRRWCRRWEETGNVKDKPRSGKPRKTTPDEDRAIIETATLNPLQNAVSIKDTLHLQVSAGTVRNRLHSNGIHHRNPALKEKLEDRHKAARLQFAQQHVEDGLDYWGRVIFSDEKTFASNTHGRLHCWRRDNTRYESQNIYEVARSGHITCNVWGWIHLYGIGELTEVTGRFTADQYIEILEEVMVPSVRAMALPYPERIIFMQDNCSIHTARIVRTWFAEQPDIELLQWPSKGCDLNPIENVWGNIVNSWEQDQERNRQRLLNHTMDEWELFRHNPQIIYNHVSSMQTRLQCVIENNGGWTKY